MPPGRAPPTGAGGLDDINENGAASSTEAAEQRPVPEYQVAADLVYDPD